LRGNYVGERVHPKKPGRYLVVYTGAARAKPMPRGAAAAARGVEDGIDGYDRRLVPILRR